MEARVASGSGNFGCTWAGPAPDGLFNSGQTPIAGGSTIREGDTAVTTLLVILLLLWVLGLATANTLGGLIHVLLVVALVIFILRMFQGRNPLRG